MGSRGLPPIKREAVAPEHQPVFDRLNALGEKAFGPPDTSDFIWKRKDGGLVGPFPALLAHPNVGTAFLDINAAMAEIPGLPADAREVAVVATGARFQAAYELYAHTVVAEKQAGIAREQVEAIVQGRKPSGLNEKCEVAYDVSAYLANQSGPLPKGLWDRSVEVLGRDGTMALVHYVGFYAYTCVVLNAIDAPVPQPDD